MAEITNVPEGFEPPEVDWGNFDFHEYDRNEQRWRERLIERCKENGDHPLLGELLRWQRADGYACYLVWDVAPLTLVHLDYGDGYTVEPALIRGLTLDDVEEQVAARKRLSDLFRSR